MTAAKGKTAAPAPAARVGLEGMEIKLAPGQGTAHVVAAAAHMVGQAIREALGPGAATVDYPAVRESVRTVAARFAELLADAVGADITDPARAAAFVKALADYPPVEIGNYVVKETTLQAVGGGRAIRALTKVPRQ